mmetsp:Transcript_3092/g.9940  ORF Transcript_3092/g.9940 Transcript_3092/m.9940 type:complete len:309 (+) Transcript_3092:1-927(+)
MGLSLHWAALDWTASRPPAQTEGWTGGPTCRRRDARTRSAPARVSSTSKRAAPPRPPGKGPARGGPGPSAPRTLGVLGGLQPLERLHKDGKGRHRQQDMPPAEPSAPSGEKGDQQRRRGAHQVPTEDVQDEVAPEIYTSKACVEAQQPPRAARSGKSKGPAHCAAGHGVAGRKGRAIRVIRARDSDPRSSRDAGRWRRPLALQEDLQPTVCDLACGQRQEREVEGALAAQQEHGDEDRADALPAKQDRTGQHQEVEGAERKSLQNIREALVQAEHRFHAPESELPKGSSTQMRPEWAAARGLQRKWQL